MLKYKLLEVFLMLHGINNTYLYSAKKIIARWSNGIDCIELRGTGFFIDKDGDPILITNRHVVEPGYDDRKYEKFNVVDMRFETISTTGNDAAPQVLSIASIVNYKDFVFHPNPNNDVACLKHLQISGGNTISVSFSIPYSMLATSEWIASKLLVCDTIAYPGFPEWYDRQNNTPIFRIGTIASDPRLNYSYIPGAPDAARIAYEGFSTGGASGSPVFAIQRGFPTGGAIRAPEGFYREVKLIGINAGHFNDQKGHSGISYLYKSSAIHDIID